MLQECKHPHHLMCKHFTLFPSHRHCAQPYHKQFCSRVILSWSHRPRDSASSNPHHVRRYILAAEAAERRAGGPGQICEHERVRKAALKCAFCPFQSQRSDRLFTLQLRQSPQDRPRSCPGRASPRQLHQVRPRPKARAVLSPTSCSVPGEARDRFHVDHERE